MDQAKTDNEKAIEVLRSDDSMFEKVIDQPVEGLLWDIDLLPEQCTDGYKAIYCRIIKALHKKAFGDMYK